jgi:hypothetical protein
MSNQGGDAWSALSAFATRFAALFGAIALIVSVIVFMAQDSLTMQRYIRTQAGTDALSASIEVRLTSIESGVNDKIDLLSNDLGRITRTLDASTATLSNTAQTVQTLVTNQSREAVTLAESVEPCIVFEPGGHEATDTAIGAIVQVRILFRVMRDCGRARHIVNVRNGSRQHHVCENPSFADELGYTSQLRPAPEQVREVIFTCRLPADEGIHAGRAWLWLAPFFPDAPNADNRSSPEVPFMIPETG